MIENTIFTKDDINTNYDFWQKYILLLDNIKYIKDTNYKIILYGYGEIGKIIQQHLSSNIILYVDQNYKNLPDFVKSPKEIQNNTYDYILISALGREYTIEQFLYTLKVDRKKILKLKLKQNYVKKTIQLNDIQLSINPNDKGGLMYESKSSYEDANNYIYKQINDYFKPSHIFDIGANYGYTAILFSKFFPNARLTLVEASKELIPYIKQNLSLNTKNKFNIVNAICAKEDNKLSTFSINPAGSQDNRVIAETTSWENEEVNSITLNKLFELNKSDFYFIKIDTQGYEKHIFEGGSKYLDNNKNWIIKTEFAPFCLISQGTNPINFLKNLILKYNVCEVPLRSKFKYDDIKTIFKNTLLLDDIEEFINYIENNDKDKKGWCDLFIYPKKLNFPKKVEG